MADDGCDGQGRWWLEMERLFVTDTFSTDCSSYDDVKWTGAVVGKWYGPIENPMGDIDDQ